MEKVIYISSIETFYSGVGEINFSHTPIIKNGDLGLFVTLDDLSNLSCVEILGTYDEVFADATKLAKYKSVNDFETPQSYIDENNQTVTYYKPKYIGTFGVTEKVLTKQEQLDSIIVTVSSGKRFYADPISRADLSDAISEAIIIGASDSDITTWKTPEGIMEVTLAELKEARSLGLKEKAKIIGIENV